MPGTLERSSSGRRTRPGVSSAGTVSRLPLPGTGTAAVQFFDVVYVAEPDLVGDEVPDREDAAVDEPDHRVDRGLDDLGQFVPRKLHALDDGVERISPCSSTRQGPRP
jgi:hypothetical protein